MQKQEQIELNQGAKGIVRGLARYLTEDGKRPKLLKATSVTLQAFWRT